MLRHPFIRGQRLYLRALIESDADGPYVDWFNDEEVCRGNSHHVFPYTRSAAVEFIQEVRRRRDLLVLAIVSTEGDRHIGNVSLQGIDPLSQSAEFAIVIGDRDAWGKGHGEEAGHLLLAHGFRTLNLHRIYCGTYETNVGMQRLAKKLGMREEGRRRQAAFKNDRFIDIVEFGILRGEFDERPTAGSDPDA